MRRFSKRQYFQKIADEVNDVANREEVSLVLRYVFQDVVKEVFVGFIAVDRITGVALAESILNWLRKYKLPVSAIRGQCYDGASNMSGACTVYSLCF